MQKRIAALAIALLASAGYAQITPRAYTRTQDVARASVPDTQPIDGTKGSPLRCPLG